MRCVIPPDVWFVLLLTPCLSEHRHVHMDSVSPLDGTISW